MCENYYDTAHTLLIMETCAQLLSKLITKLGGRSPSDSCVPQIKTCGIHEPATYFQFLSRVSTTHERSSWKLLVWMSVVSASIPRLWTCVQNGPAGQSVSVIFKSSMWLSTNRNYYRRIHHCILSEKVFNKKPFGPIRYSTYYTLVVRSTWEHKCG